MPVPDQPVRPSVDHLQGDHGAVRHEGTAIVETGGLVGQAPHREAVQPVPHALPVGSDREGRAANQNGAPGRDRVFEHGSPLPGSGGAYGASVESMGARCRSTTATAVVESGDARGSSETRSGGRAYARCSTSSVALSDTGLASSKRPSFPVNVIWRGKLTQTTAPATGPPAG